MSTPAVEIRTFAVTIAAGTAKAAPQVTSISFPARVVTAVHWRVPPGPSGLMGWKLTMSGGQAVLPTGGGFIVTDDDKDQWTVVDQPDSGAWEVTGYNTDIYDHTVYLDFFLDLVGQQVTATTFIPNAALSSPAAVTAPGAVTLSELSPLPVTVPSFAAAPGG